MNIVPKRRAFVKQNRLGSWQSAESTEPAGIPSQIGYARVESADGNSPSAKGGAILDGQYAAQLPPGEWIVRITATRVIGTRKVYEDAPDSPIKEVTEQFLPKQFNTESDLRVKIDAKRDDLHFKLKVD